MAANSNSIPNSNSDADVDVDSHRLNTCRIVELVVCPSTSSLVTPAPSDLDTTTTHTTTTTQTSSTSSSTDNLAGLDCIQLQIVLFPHQLWPIAKQFWQHAGDGISSRLAERALAFMGERPPPPLALSLRVEGEGEGEGERPAAPAVNGSAQSIATATATTASTSNAKSLYSRNRHYSRKPSTAPPPGTTTGTTGTTSAAPIPHNDEESLSIDHATYLEERYGRNLPLTSVKLAKSALRRRIAGELVPHEDGSVAVATAAQRSEQPQPHQHDLQRGGKGKLVTEDDVYLYPTGMSAIWHAHAIAGALRERSGGRPGKSVCFG
jgi:cystathionine gamma-synthase